MKKITLKSILQLLKTVATCIPLVFSVSGCGENQAATNASIGSNLGICVSLGFDQTQSFIDYRRQDTNFVAAICRSVTLTGGLVVAYSIGEPTDLSGIRCYLMQVPRMNHDLVLSKQAELKQKINAVTAENDKQIHDFLKKVQLQIFAPISDSSKKINNTDLNGFFKKVAVLLDEPEIQNMTQYVFCYSDGIQSLNGKDSPASFRFKPKSKFILCLAGWKTKHPCDSIEIKKFEDPQGFIQYLSSNNSFNH